MNEQKDEKWLDELITRTINTTKPEFDPEKWKQKYPEEFQMLKSWAGQGSRVYQPNIWRIIIKNPITKLAAAAAIIIAVSLLIFHQGAREKEPVQSVSVQKSPGELLTVASLNMAYRRGGMGELEKQCDEAIKMLGPRPAKITVKELLAEFNGI